MTRPIFAPAADEVVAPLRAAARLKSAAGDARLIDRLVVWPIARPRRSGLQTAAAAAIVVAALRFPSFVDGEWASFFAHLRAGAFVLGWMLLATLLVRTITPRQVITTWLAGVFVAGVLVDAIGAVVDDHVSGNAFIAVLVPVLEESMKVLPVTLFALISRRRGQGFGALDLGILGAASGAGFAMYEDMLWGRRFVAGLSGGWSNVFPTMLLDPVFVGGHLVWSALVGLGIGVLYVHRSSAAAWVAGPLLIAVPLLDHMAVNYRGDEYASLRSALLDGELVLWLLIATFSAVLIAEIRVVHSSASRDHLFRPRTFRELATAPLPPPFSVRTSHRQFQRLRNAVVFDNHLERPTSARSAGELAWLEARIVNTSNPTSPVIQAVQDRDTATSNSATS